jgi:DNA-directed RNA polymerase subunit K/omega
MEKRISPPIMTKFEKTDLIGERAEQIARGVKPLIKFDPMIEKFIPYEIAKKEIEEKVVPLQISRKMPDGTTEIWDIKELRQIK